MNKTRRQWLQDVIATLEAAREEIDSIYNEEQDACDNMPENLQDSERAQTLYDNASDLDTASQELEDIISNLQEITER